MSEFMNVFLPIILGIFSIFAIYVVLFQLYFRGKHYRVMGRYGLFCIQTKKWCYWGFLRDGEGNMYLFDSSDAAQMVITIATDNKMLN